MLMRRRRWWGRYRARSFVRWDGARRSGSATRRIWARRALYRMRVEQFADVQHLRVVLQVLAPMIISLHARAQEVIAGVIVGGSLPNPAVWMSGGAAHRLVVRPAKRMRDGGDCAREHQED